MIALRRLTEDDFQQCHLALVEAFSDYYLKIQPTNEGLRRLFTIEGVDFSRSVGAFDAGKLVGFVVNAIGSWDGMLTAYDAGTGVIPAYRGRGISRRMFEFILPVLRENSVRQYLLEVITENAPAISLYEQLGFRRARRVLVFSRSKQPENIEVQPGVEVREIENPDWKLLEKFCEFRPCWQNSTDSIERAAADKTIQKKILGLYFKGDLAGFGVVFVNSGNVAQFGLDSELRGRGFRKLLLARLAEATEKPLLFANIEEEERDFIDFLLANDSRLLTSQYEMLLKL